MRLWHYELIPVLPQAQLVSQWRECIAIKRQWEKGTLNHGLVKYVMNYDRKYFLAYIYRVTSEMKLRGIKYKISLFTELYDFCSNEKVTYFTLDEANYPEHNDRYLIQCYHNLQEKADRGLISQEEWNKIGKFMKGRIIIC